MNRITMAQRDCRSEPPNEIQNQTVDPVGKERMDLIQE